MEIVARKMNATDFGSEIPSKRGKTIALCVVNWLAFIGSWRWDMGLPQLPVSKINGLAQ